MGTSRPLWALPVFPAGTLTSLSLKSPASDRLTSGMGSDRRLQSFSWALSLTPHHRAESKFCQIRPKQMATHWRSKGWGSSSCSRQMAIRFPWRQASCEEADGTAWLTHRPRVPTRSVGPGHCPDISWGNLA